MKNKIIRYINILITVTCLTVLFASCAMFEKAEGSSVSFKLDSETFEKIKVAAGEAESANTARSAEDTAAASSIFIEVAVHGGYEKSTVVEVTNEATISIDNIPMGSEIYLEATAFIKNDGERQNLYKGHSKKFVVRESENLVMFILYRVGDGEGSEGGNGSASGASGSGGSAGSGTGGGGTSGIVVTSNAGGSGMVTMLPRTEPVVITISNNDETIDFTKLKIKVGSTEYVSDSLRNFVTTGTTDNENRYDFSFGSSLTGTGTEIIIYYDENEIERLTVMRPGNMG